MSEQNILAPLPGGRVTPARFIPPLPEGIPILPGRFKAAKAPWRFKRLAIMSATILCLAGLMGLAWRHSSRADEDKERIDSAMTQALQGHAPKGARIPVTLSSGPRILRLDVAAVWYNAGQPPETCGTASVLDPKTGAMDSNYPFGVVTTCVHGLVYRTK